MSAWAALLVALIGALGGSAGVVALIRLFWLEPKVARQSETAALWSENRALRGEIRVLREDGMERDARIVTLERHLMQCEAENESFKARLNALEGK